MRKRKTEERIKAIEMHKQGIPRRRIAEELGVSHDSVKTWISLYKSGQKDLLDDTRKKRTYSKAVKLEAVSAHLEAVSYTHLEAPRISRHNWGVKRYGKISVERRIDIDLPDVGARRRRQRPLRDIAPRRPGIACRENEQRYGREHNDFFHRFFTSPAIRPIPSSSQYEEWKNLLPGAAPSPRRRVR